MVNRVDLRTDEDVELFLQDLGLRVDAGVVCEVVMGLKRGRSMYSLHTQKRHRDGRVLAPISSKNTVKKIKGMYSSDKLAPALAYWAGTEGLPPPENHGEAFPEEPSKNDEQEMVAQLRGIEIQLGGQTHDVATLLQAVGPGLLFPLMANDVAQKLSDRGFQGTMKKMPMGGDGPATRGIHELLESLVDSGILDFEDGSRSKHTRLYYLTDQGSATLRFLKASSRLAVRGVDFR